MTGLRAERVDDTAGLFALESEWRALWRAVPGASPFQSPEWLLPWWEQFGTTTPRVAVLRDAVGRLCGLLPLYRLDAEAKLLPIGAGSTDQHDVLLAADLSPEAATLLLGRALHGEAVPCDLPDLHPDSPLLRAEVAGWRAHCGAGAACPLLPLGPALEQTVPAAQRRKLRMARHRADRAGGWQVTLCNTQSVQEAADTFQQLHEARWSGPDPRLAAFRRVALPLLCRAGLLRLAVLRLAGRAVGAVLALADAGSRLLFYLGGFDPEAAFFSPGTLLIGALLEHAIAEGFSVADFLRGQEAYKYAWGARDRALASLRLEPAG